MITVIMECMYCNRMFSTKHSLATHKSRYHNTDFQSECEDNESLIRLMMKAVLDGDVVLTAVEKKRLKPTRESIRKIVNCEKSLSEVFDKKLELAIKLIIKLVKQKFPTLIFESPMRFVYLSEIQFVICDNMDKLFEFSEDDSRDFPTSIVLHFRKAI
eukprot:sb/3473057/